MKRVIIDTNVFLHFLLRDSESLFKKAKTIFNQAKQGKTKILVPEIVIFEIQFTLEKYYLFKKIEIIDKIKSILSAPYLIIESEDIFKQALQIYKLRNDSFVDCFLLVKSKKEKAKLVTFDKSLSKH